MLHISGSIDGEVYLNNESNSHRNYACIILAAGQSKRMARSKIVLPWEKKTVIGTIISSFQSAGIKHIVVVTGGYRELVEEEVKKYDVEAVFNPDFANGEMALSLKTGLRKISSSCDGVFVALGDQPDIHPIDLIGIMGKSDEFPDKLIIPSYSMRRGHPWLVPTIFFPEIKGIKSPDTMKTFIQNHEGNVEYYLVKKSNILADLDTPEDYERLKPNETN
jgi:molybdenum cofactor cytidylyltransferase